MITRVSKNVICIKDIPSNLIEEAIFILKSNNVGDENKIQTKRSKDFLMKEIENVVSEYNNKFQNEYNKKKKIEKAKKIKMKKLKIKVLALSLAFVFTCLVIALTIK